MSEVEMIYKITALFLLSKADFPLSNSQISGFFIEGKYTDYFRIQQIISSLVDAKMISVEKGKNENRYQITEEGQSTLELFEERITEDIKKEVKAFYEDNGIRMKKVNAVSSDYYVDPLM